MTGYFLQNPAVLAAFLSAVATGIAAWAAWKGPVAAARAAEDLRRNNDDLHERRRLKMWVFSTLMQERAYIASIDAVRALNLIDVVFRDASPVREAWANLFLAYATDSAVPRHVQDERLRLLLREMAIDLGIADSLRGDDLGRVYYPQAIEEEERLRQLERKVALGRLQNQLNPTANTVVENSNTSAWPPRPE